MTTIAEKTKDGIIYRAAKTYPIPDVDILTLLFGSCYLLFHFRYPLGAISLEDDPVDASITGSSARDYATTLLQLY